jgi:hypothetical protein
MANSERMLRFAHTGTGENPLSRIRRLCILLIFNWLMYFMDQGQKGIPFADRFAGKTDFARCAAILGFGSKMSLHETGKLIPGPEQGAQV